jgi:superfamily II DNA or RNA helicase
VIFDEIHHAGDEQSWGEKLLYAFEGAAKVIGLTGTPWRRPKSGRIPFVDYDGQGSVHPDYEYSYGQAVTDKVCRVMQFHAYDAQIQCVELQTAQSTSRSLSDLTDRQDRSQAMTAILDTKRDWMRSVLEKGHAELLNVRAGTVDDGAVSDAQGLVIADDQDHAREIAALLQRVTGEAPELIISDEPDAEAALARFKRGSRRWAVAVNKVSEGVDVAALYVGIYATRKTSPLLFRQIVGRFVRRRHEMESRDAVLFMPAVPDLMQLASEIQEELRHAVETALDEQEAEQERERRESDEPSEPGEPDLWVWEADDATLSGVIRSGERYSASEVQSAQLWADRLKAQGIVIDPIAIALYERLNPRQRGQMASEGADVTTAPTTTAQATAPRVMTREEQKRHLQRKLDKAAKQAAYETGATFDGFNQYLARKFGKPRSALSMDEMAREIEHINELVRQFRARESEA